MRSANCTLPHLQCDRSSEEILLSIFFFTQLVPEVHKQHLYTVSFGLHIQRENYVAANTVLLISVGHT